MNEIGKYSHIFAQCEKAAKAAAFRSSGKTTHVCFYLSVWDGQLDFIVTRVRNWGGGGFKLKGVKNWQQFIYFHFHVILPRH